MKKSRGIVFDRGYIKIRIWPNGKMGKVFIEHFGPVNSDNLARAEFKLREYRNQIASGKFEIEKQEQRIRFSEAAELYLKLYGASKDTEEQRRDMEHRLKILKAFFGPVYLDEINPQHVISYRRSREKSGVKYSTVNREQAVLGSLFERFDEWNELGNYLTIRVKLPAKNPCRYVKKPTELPLKRTRVMSPEEWDRLKAFLEDEMLDHCKMALYSSLRLKDVSLLAGKKVDGEVLRALQAKTHREYMVPLTESLRKVAMRIAARPFKSAWTVQKQFRTACQSAKINDMTFRDLRRTGLSWLDKLGFRRTALRDKAGHADSRTTDLYLVSGVDEQLDGIRKLEDTFK